MTPNWFIGWMVDPGDWFALATQTPPDNVRVFAPDDLHMTLAFLGAVSEIAARRAWDVILNASLASHPIRLARVEPFGRPSKPSAFAAVPDADTAPPFCDDILALRDPILAAANARPDTRPPRPHITLARPPRRADAHTRRDALAWAERITWDTPPTLTLSKMALYTWSTDRRVRLFREVEIHTL